jgi:hypothetical protein
MTDLPLLRVLVTALCVLTVMAGSLVPRDTPVPQCIPGSAAIKNSDCLHAALALVNVCHGLESLLPHVQWHLTSAETMLPFLH